jgi:hypothetical protein
MSFQYCCLILSEIIVRQKNGYHKNSDKMKLSNNALAELKSSNVIKAELVIAFDKSHRTIERWIETNNIMLTTKDCVDIIVKNTKLKEQEILIED